MKIILQFAIILSLVLVHNVSLAQMQFEPGKVVIQPINPITRELLSFSQVADDIRVPGFRSSRHMDTNFDGSVIVRSQKTFLLNPQRNAVASILDEKLPFTKQSPAQLNLSYSGDRLAYKYRDGTDNRVVIANPITKEAIATFRHETESIVESILFLEANADLSRLVYTFSFGSQFRGLAVLKHENGKITKDLELVRIREGERPFETLNIIRMSSSGNFIFFRAAYQKNVQLGEPTTFTGGMFELKYKNGEWVGPTKIEPEGVSGIRPLDVAKDGEMLLIKKIVDPSGIFIINRIEGSWSKLVPVIEDVTSGFNKYTISEDGRVIAASEARRPVPPPGSDAPINFDINVYFFDKTAPNSYRREQLTNENMLIRGQHLLSRDGTRLFWRPEAVLSAVQLPGN